MVTTPSIFSPRYFKESFLWDEWKVVRFSPTSFFLKCSVEKKLESGWKLDKQVDILWPWPSPDSAKKIEYSPYETFRERSNHHWSTSTDEWHAWYSEEMVLDPDKRSYWEVTEEKKGFNLRGLECESRKRSKNLMGRFGEEERNDNGDKLIQLSEETSTYFSCSSRRKLGPKTDPSQKSETLKRTLKLKIIM